MAFRRFGYQFLWNHYFPGISTIRVTQRSLISPSENYSLLVYTPVRDSIATIITFPGLSVHGYHDQRMARLSSALSRLGFLVITPCIADIERLVIDPATIDKFAELIQAVFADTALNPGQQKISFFSASYSGGIAMLAACRQPVAACINSVCLVGAFSNFSNVLHFVIGENTTDDYARNIILRNFLQRSHYQDDSVIHLLTTAIEDNGFQRKNPHLPHHLQSVPVSSLSLYEKLQTDVDFRQKLVYQVLTEIDQTEKWSEKFSLTGKLDQVTFPVFLIHGNNDNVIPASESRSLHEELNHLGKQSELLLTSLLDHGDLTINLDLFSELDKLARSFGSFIEHSRKPF